MRSITRGLGRKLRSSLLLNSSPRTSRDFSLSHLVEIRWSPRTCALTVKKEQLRQSGGIDGVMRGDEDALLRQAVHDDKDGGESG